ncbi:MAG: GldG family protein [Spirochaetales bacterium]|nr:GldG family protein [Spirochaetales bacterium]
MKFTFNFKAKQAAMATVSLILIIAGIIILNLIVGKIPAQWDMTPKKLYSLTDDTKDVLSGLNQDITIYALFPVGQEVPDIMEVLKLYENSSKHITVETVDPDRNPGLLKRFQEEENTELTKGSLVVFTENYFKVIAYLDMYDTSMNQQGQMQVFGFAAEQRITSALAYVNTGYSPGLYEISGHFEKTLADIGLTKGVEKSNFQVSDVNLLRDGGIPAEADVVLLNSPKSDFNPQEIAALRTYLEQGGHLFVALDLTQEPLTNLYALLEEYNIVVQYGVTLEKDTNRQLPGSGNNPIFFAPFVKEHDITASIRENKLDPFFAYAMGIGTTESMIRNIKVEPLMTSSAKSFLRTDLNDGAEEMIASDIPGPVTVAAAVYRTSRDTGFPEGMKMVIISSGNSLTAMPGLGQIKANSDFFVDAVSWLSDQEDSINIKSKSLYKLPLQMNAVNAWIYAGIAIILIPLLVAAAGFIVLIRRKNL